MKTIILPIVGMCACLWIGYVFGQHAAPKSISPKCRQFLRYTFGKDDIRLVTDEEAQIVMNGWELYRREGAFDQSLPWSVRTFCKLNELDASGVPEPATNYIHQVLTQFFADYHSGHYLKPEFAKFFDKLYRDLTSDTNRFDYTRFEQHGGECLVSGK